MLTGSGTAWFGVLYGKTPMSTGEDDEIDELKREITPDGQWQSLQDHLICWPVSCTDSANSQGAVSDGNYGLKKCIGSSLDADGVSI